MLRSRRASFAVAILLLISLGFSWHSASAAPLQQGDINPADFVPVVDNRYFPLQPGTSYIYEGVVEGHTLRAVMTVSTATRVILGVRCTEVLDDLTEDGEPLEQTVDWYAQDKEGNVWYFGEDTREYGDGGVSTEGSWLAGNKGARPGIIMEANPKIGDAYNQEQAPGDAEDMAQVVALNESVTVRYGSFTDVLVTEETTPLEPGYRERKYYAPGIGYVRSFDVAGGQERLQLTEILKLRAGMPRTGTGPSGHAWPLSVLLGGALCAVLGLALRRNPRRDIPRLP